MSRLTTSDARQSGSRRRAAVRWLLRGAALAAVVVLLLPLGRTGAAGYVAGASPLVAGCSVIAARALHAAVLLGLVMAAVVFVRHRWFCRWACPMGFCADEASHLGRKLGCRRPPLPRVGQWIAVVAVGGAVFGYPLLLWLDPLALLSGVFSLGGPEHGWTAVALAAGLPAVLILSLLMPGAWCARLCPLGGLQELLHGLSVFVRLSRVDGPTRRGDDATATRETRWQVGRRAALGAALGAAWAAATRRALAAGASPLRPPGARGEEVFTGLCIRCGNCLRACPHGIIVPELGEHGIAGLLAPQLSFEADYCREDCVRCTEVCPSGAIVRLSKKDKPLALIGLPRVDMNVCLLGDDRECAACRNACPFEAVSYVFDEVEYTLTPRIDLAKCPGCGACELACPTMPKAIVVVAK